MRARLAAVSRAGRARAPQFLRFAIVGGVGFAVDAGLLLVGVKAFGLDPIGARLATFSVAVLATFELNRRWAFANSRDRPYLRALASYLGVQGLGFVCNFGVYTLLYLTLPARLALPVLCLAAASGVALVVNYVGASIVVFGSGRSGRVNP